MKHNQPPIPSLAGPLSEDLSVTLKKKETTFTSVPYDSITLKSLAWNQASVSSNSNDAVLVTWDPTDNSPLVHLVPSPGFSRSATADSQSFNHKTQHINHTHKNSERRAIFPNHIFAHHIEKTLLLFSILINSFI